MPRPKRKVPWLDTRNDVYYVFWYDDAQRRTRRLSLETREPDEAERRFGAFLLERDKFVVPQAAGPALRVSQVLDDYLREQFRDRPRTREYYASKSLRTFFGNMRPAEIGVSQCRVYEARRRAGEIGGAASGGAIRRELGVLRAAIRHEVKWKRLNLAEVPVLEVPPDNPPRDRVVAWPVVEGALPKEENGRLSNVYRFAAIAYWTASRKTAILELAWSQVNILDRRITLNPSGRSQTKKRRPVVPIAHELVPVLERSFREKTGLYVLDRHSKPSDRFREAMQKAGLTDVTPHTLRHSRATHLAQAGVSMWSIAKLLGDTVATVEKNYLHHSPEYLKEVIDATGPRPQNAARS